MYFFNWNPTTSRRSGTLAGSSTRSGRCGQHLGSAVLNFALCGQSWRGILAIEYALAHQQHLRALVISNMIASAPAYTANAENVLAPAMDQGALREIRALETAHDIANPRYMELLLPQH